MTNTATTAATARATAAEEERGTTKNDQH